MKQTNKHADQQGQFIVLCGLRWGWSGITRRLCAGVSCGPPLHVANGVVRGAVFQFGDVAVYTCFAGYAMEGRSRSRCLENGTWTPPPTCRGDQPPTHTTLPLSSCSSPCLSSWRVILSSDCSCLEWDLLLSRRYACVRFSGELEHVGISLSSLVFQPWHVHTQP